MQKGLHILLIEQFHRSIRGADLVTHYSVSPYFSLRYSIQEVFPIFRASRVLPVIFPGNRYFALLLRTTPSVVPSVQNAQDSGKTRWTGHKPRSLRPTPYVSQRVHFRVKMLPSIPMRKRLSILYTQLLPLIYGTAILRFPGKAPPRRRPRELLLAFFAA